MQPRHKSMAAIALVLVGFAGLTGASIALSHPAEGASVASQTQISDATIEGSGPSGIPAEVVVSASGSIEWENMDAYDARVGIYVGNGSAGDADKMIAHEEFRVDSSERSAAFANVSGDVMDVRDQRYFTHEFDGGTRVQHVPIEVRVQVCEFDVEHGGVCATDTDRYNVTVKVHNEPDQSNETAVVSASTSLDGHITFEGDESDDRPPEEGTPNANPPGGQYG